MEKELIMKLADQYSNFQIPDTVSRVKNSIKYVQDDITNAETDIKEYEEAIAAAKAFISKSNEAILKLDQQLMQLAGGQLS